METVDHFGTPGLVEEIAGAVPSFNEQWLDDPRPGAGGDLHFEAEKALT